MILCHIILYYVIISYLLTVPIQNVSMVDETEDCSLFAIKLSPHAKTKGADGSGEIGI
jgi:hypothetical protein